MGTRNLTIVKVDGEIKVAQYCQWDGYLTGQGHTIADFIQKHLDLRKFKKAVRSLTWADAATVKATWTDCGADPKSDTVTFAIADKHGLKYPEFNRDTGADILKLIQDGKVTQVKNDIDFLDDSLFCEYAYELDLDKKTVSIYKGFQTTGKTSDGHNVYGRCKKWKTVSFATFNKKKINALAKLDGEE